MTGEILNAIPRFLVTLCLAINVLPVLKMTIKNHPPGWKSGMLWLSLGLAIHVLFALPNEIKWAFRALSNGQPFDPWVAVVKICISIGYGIIAYGCWRLLHERRSRRDG